MAAAIKIGRRRVEVTRQDKPMFPSGETKGDLVHYYAEVAPALVRHAKGRPIAMQRFPEGVGHQGFFQKKAGDYYPDWIRTVTVPKQGGELEEVVMCDGPTLVYLANQAVVTPHLWLSRADHLDRPDRLIFDFDPSGGTFADIRRAARDCGGLLREAGLAPFAMVTGSRGIHVTVPLRRAAATSFDRVRAFAREVAEEMVARDPRRLTLEARKAKRGDRILVDVMRNSYAQTAVAPYAVRARDGAPVAMPLRWEELEDRRLQPDRWRMRTALERLDRDGDAWRDIRSHARALP
jgi:bifunctional non-homologous end joining protein LigD